MSSTSTVLPGTYLCILGINPLLSRTELDPYIKEITYDESKNISICTDVQVHNPRKLPKTDEQIFLDRLGGTQRVAKVITTVKDTPQALEHIVMDIAELYAPKAEAGHKFMLGLSVYGMGKGLRQMMKQISHNLGELPHKWVNSDEENITSGRYFHEKLGRKGAEYILYSKNPGEVMVCRTVANQNLRNYALRDRAKQGDAHMGMLPPKLAQMLINLAQPLPDETVMDPFCGSGTINAEAAIMGYKTIGGDISEPRIKMAQQNFSFLSEKFRYSHDAGKFMKGDATQVNYSEYDKTIVATEGWLGRNFTSRPTRLQALEQAEVVALLWHKFWKQLQRSTIRSAAFCLPYWYTRDGNISVRKKVLASAAKCGYIPVALLDKSTSYIYAREGAYVGREICIVHKTAS